MYHVYQEKMTKYAKEEKKFDEPIHASEPESDIAEMLELLEEEFKTSTINMLRPLMVSRQHGRIDGKL